MQSFIAPLAFVNPFESADHEIATWFHHRFTPVFVTVLHALTEFGSREWIGIVLFALVLFFAVETMVAISGHADHRRARWHAVERVAEARRASASPVCRWPVCRLVWLQFRQCPYDRCYFPVRTAFAFSAASAHKTPPAKHLHFRRDSDSVAGRIQSRGIGGAFSH